MSVRCPCPTSGTFDNSFSSGMSNAVGLVGDFAGAQKKNSTGESLWNSVYRMQVPVMPNPMPTTCMDPPKPSPPPKFSDPPASLVSDNYWKTATMPTNTFGFF